MERREPLLLGHEDLNNRASREQPFAPRHHGPARIREGHSRCGFRLRLGACLLRRLQRHPRHARDNLAIETGVHLATLRSLPGAFRFSRDGGVGLPLRLFHLLGILCALGIFRGWRDSREDADVIPRFLLNVGMPLDPAAVRVDHVPLREEDWLSMPFVPLDVEQLLERLLLIVRHSDEDGSHGALRVVVEAVPLSHRRIGQGEELPQAGVSDQVLLVGTHVAPRAVRQSVGAHVPLPLRDAIHVVHQRTIMSEGSRGERRENLLMEVGIQLGKGLLCILREHRLDPDTQLSALRASLQHELDSRVEHDETGRMLA
mmetsp:Transcript_19822/g.74949  ORF Transcript_19822/g.74949 Transcript_19822/m.74949 type:complete len:316 (+) Transcript_19822:1684-2631(+)